MSLKEINTKLNLKKFKKNSFAKKKEHYIKIINLLDSYTHKNKPRILVATPEEVVNADPENEEE